MQNDNLKNRLLSAYTSLWETVYTRNLYKYCKWEKQKWDFICPWCEQRILLFEYYEEDGIYYSAEVYERLYFLVHDLGLEIRISMYLEDSSTDIIWEDFIDKNHISYEQCKDFCYTIGEYLQESVIICRFAQDLEMRSEIGDSLTNSMHFKNPIRYTFDEIMLLLVDIDPDVYVDYKGVNLNSKVEQQILELIAE